MFRSDIILREPGSPDLVLVAEIKPSLANRSQVESQLREYMRQMGCLNGLIVTPQTTLVFHETYRGAPTQSIRLVGEVPTQLLLGVAEVPGDPIRLESLLRDWLERVAHNPWSAIPEELHASQPELSSALG